MPICLVLIAPILDTLLQGRIKSYVVLLNTQNIIRCVEDSREIAYLCYIRRGLGERLVCIQSVCYAVGGPTNRLVNKEKEEEM